MMKLKRKRMHSTVIDITHNFPSLNKFYASKHWGYRKNEKLKFNKYLDSLNINFPSKDIDLEQRTYTMSVKNFTRMDNDNVIMICKFVNDYLKTNGYIKDDSRKYFREVSIHTCEKQKEDDRRCSITIEFSC
jgi:Holliday junction resolvase RusA-like endonuclease